MSSASDFIAGIAQQAIEREIARVFGLPNCSNTDRGNLTWAHLKQAASSLPKRNVVYYFTDKRIPLYHVYIAKSPYCAGTVIGAHPDYIAELMRQSMGVDWVKYSEWKQEE